MQPAYFRHFDHSTDVGKLNRPGFRSILGQGQMRAGPMIILKERFQRAAQGRFVYHDDVIEALSAYGTDQPFHVWGLQRRARSREYFRALVVRENPAGLSKPMDPGTRSSGPHIVSTSYGFE